MLIVEVPRPSSEEKIEPGWMAPFNKEEEFHHFTEKMLNTYRHKNHDYGGSFANTFKEFGLIASAIRLSDKLERIKSFAKMSEEEIKVKDESIEDTLLDMANYAVMTLVEIGAAKDEQFKNEMQNKM